MVNILGQTVWEYQGLALNAGSVRVNRNGKQSQDISSGIYFLNLSRSNKRTSKKLTMLKL